MSPVATMTDTEAEHALLEAADSLFYTRGVASVSMAKIRDTSGLSMRRLYAIAQSKSDLISLWLRHRHTAWMDGFAALVEQRLAAGRDPVDALFDALESWMIDTDFRGCGFINTHAESSELTNEHRQIIQEHKTELARYLSSVAPHGATLAVIVDGAIVQASIFANTEPISLAREAARALTSNTGEGKNS